MASWDSPSSSPSLLDLDGIPVSMLEEHVKALEEDMPYDDEASTRQRDIAQIRWHISQLNHQQQQKSPKQYPNDNLEIGTINTGFDFDSAQLESDRSYGNPSNSDSSLFFYDGVGLGGDMNGSGAHNRKRHRESLGAEDDVEFDTKSPRYTPSPRNFAHSPSPARNGYKQNEYVIFVCFLSLMFLTGKRSDTKYLAIS
jgi:hypothetical protein